MLEGGHAPQALCRSRVAAGLVASRGATRTAVAGCSLPMGLTNQQRRGARQAAAAESALAAARAQLEAAARDDISPSRAQAARQRIAALEAERARLQVLRRRVR
jgi:hypothetical protein